MLVGPLVGGAAAFWRDSAVFGITGLSMFIGIGPMLRVPETRAERSDLGGSKQRFRWWRIRGIVVPIVALFAVGTIWSMYDVVWPQYLAARGQRPIHHRAVGEPVRAADPVAGPRRRPSCRPRPTAASW